MGPSLPPTTNPSYSPASMDETHVLTFPHSHWWMMVGIVAVCLCVCILSVVAVICYHRNTRKPVKVMDPSTVVNVSELRVRNPLVVAVSIGQYDSSTLPGLPGVKDIDSLREFADFMGYAFTSNNDKAHWKKEEILLFLRDTVVGELVAGDGNVRYDSLIVCVSGHGMDGGIITSDYHLVDNDVFHRIISGPNPNLRNIPRVFIFDACNGVVDSRHMVLNSKDSVASNTEDEEQGKDTAADSILKANRMTVNDLPMPTDRTPSGKKPDFNLVQIRAANQGVMAKINEEVGSCLAQLITEHIMESIMSREDKTIAEVLKDCQQTLQRFGKEIPDVRCNNDSDGLRFEIQSRD